MGTVNDFILSVKNREGFRFDKQVANLIGVDNHSLANAKLRNKLPNNYIMWYCDRYDIEIKDFHKKIKLTNIQIELEGDNNMDARYVLDLQKDKIKHLEVENNALKKALGEKKAESNHWEALEFDYLCNVTLFRDGLKIGRTIDSVTKIDYQAKTLGYTKKEMEGFWDIGVKHNNLSSAPIDSIIDKDSLKNIQKQAMTLPILFDSLKSIIGDHYIPQPMIYIHKDGHRVPAMTYNKVEWRNLKVKSKVKFLKVSNH